MKLSGLVFLFVICCAFLRDGLAATYYINDAYTNGDVYCSARGYDTNSGDTAALPMLTITNLLAQKDLGPGDVVKIDTGTYSNYTVTLSSLHSGATGNVVLIQGSTNWVFGGTILDRGGNFTGVNLTGVTNCHLKWLTIRHAGPCIQFVGDSYSHNNKFEELVLEPNTTSQDGVYHVHRSGANSQFIRCSFIGGRNGLGGGWDLGTGGITVDGCVFYNNSSASILYASRIVALNNTVMMGGTAFDGGYPSSGDNDVFWNVDISSTEDLGNLAELQNAKNIFLRSIVADPGFADAAAGNFHPMSITGRYNEVTGNWVTDSMHSVLIDFGDRGSSAYTNELEPNGGVVNAGLYGGTWQASKSRTNAWLLALTYNDGGQAVGMTNRVYWKWGNFTNGARVDVQYSTNLGVNWANIATNIPVTNEWVNWDVSGLAAGAAYWRVVSRADGSVMDQSDQQAGISGGRVAYFVNDTSTNGDVYCTSIGNDANDGISSSTPMRSLTNLLAKYTLSGSDGIYVDTGTYSNYTVSLTRKDGGSSSQGCLLIQGSTNWAVGGTVFDRGDDSPGFTLTKGRYYHLKWLTIKRAGPCVQLTAEYSNEHNIFESLILEPNSTGQDGFQMSVRSGGNNQFVRSSVRGGKYGFAAGWSGTGGNNVDGCVFYSNTSAAINYGSSVASVSNSVVVGGTAFANGCPSSGDYNLFWNTALSYASLRELQEQQGGWWHCTMADPLFATVTNSDFHPKSTAGRYNPAGINWVFDTVTSPLVDFGDPSADYSNELDPNGSNVNAGAFGNTWQASKSPAGIRLQVLSFNDGGALDVPGGVVYWRAYNATTSDTVKIQISLNGGADWITAVTNVSAIEGSYAWIYTNGLYSSDRALWRVVSEDTPTVASTNNDEFYFHYGAANYYLNDSNLVGDVYTTAIGKDSNSGLTTNDPKYSLASLLADPSIHIRAGDVIYVDTGMYTLYSNATLSSLVITDVTERVSLIGSTNSLNGGSVWNRQSNSASAYGLSVSDVGYIAIRNIQFRNAGTGLKISGCMGVELDRIVCSGNAVDGLQIVSSDVFCEHSVFQGNTNAGIDVLSGNLYITNSVITAESPQAACYVVAGTNNVVGDYNDYYVTNNGVVAVISSTNRNADSLSAWTYWTGSDSHSLSANPLFADPVGNDYHLKSDTYAGRYNPASGWVQDSERSFLIDAGNPASDYSAEPEYNGCRLNIGLFGGTSEASKGTSNAWLHCASPDGGWVKGRAAMHWVAGGAATGGTVRIDYSADGGGSWAILTNGVSAKNEIYFWNTSATNDTPSGLWRVALTDGSVTNTATRFFGVRNNTLNLYVNDVLTNGDVYCHAGGASTNYMATSNAPLDSLVSLLAWVDLEPGDRVYMDTGLYTNTAPIVLNRTHSGVSNQPVYIQGSTSLLYRTEIECTAAAGMELNYAFGIDLHDLVFSGITDGVIARNGRNVGIRRITINDATGDGVVLTGMLFTTVSQSALVRGAGRGFRVENSTNVVLGNNVVWSNNNEAVYQRTAIVQAYNNLFTAGGTSCVYWVASGSTPQTDYNDLLLWDSAQAARYGSTSIRYLLDWQNGYTNDQHSLTHDPVFADAASGDFHPKSTMGRLNGTNWVADSEDSPLVDTGNGNSYANETEPNGRRINMGVYGNTYSASRSRTNGWLLALTCNSGGTIRGTNWLYWVAGGVVTGETVTLQYSTDGGTIWSNMASAISAADGAYQWDTTTNGPYTCLSTYWRVVSDTDTSIFSRTENSFIVNNGPISYYVNDASTNRDVYCSAKGNASYSGLSSNEPAATLEQILSSYSLRAGDTVFIDTGSYTQQTSHAFSQLSGTNMLLITGSTNGSVFYATGVSYAFSISGSSAFSLRQVTVKDATIAVNVDSSTNVLVEWVGAENCTTAFRVNNARNTSIQHCYSAGGARGVWQQGSLSSGTRVGNNVHWSNSTACIHLENGSMSVSNSVLSALASGDYAYIYLSGTTLAADYNNIILEQDGYVALYDTTVDVIYPTMADWAALGKDIHTLSRDPLFADEFAPDFHLRSQAVNGRYNPATGWVQDLETSPLIDAGGFWTTNEYPSTGSIVNIGLFGNSAQASRTPTNAWLTVISYDDGGAASGTCSLYWAVGGAATGHTVAIDLSVDNGKSWQSNAVTGVSATNRACSLDTTLFQSTPLARWKIRSINDPLIFDTNTHFFAIRNQSLAFYINDHSTTGDVYCSVIGSSTNSGAYSNAPMDDLQMLLDTYALRAGDIVYVDTGTYTPTSEVTIGEFDYGTSGNPLVIMGSTNMPFGGSILDRSGGATGLKLNKTTGVTVKHLTVQAGSTPVRADNTINCGFEWITAESSGSYGFYLYHTTGTAIKHGIAHGMTYGLYMDTAAATTWDHGVIWAKTYGIYHASGALTLGNSFIRVSGSSACAMFKGVSASYSGNYNGFSLENSARMVVQDANPYDLIYSTLGAWTYATGNDASSLIGDPGFADTLNGDFHLQTIETNGRYVPALDAWTNDAADSMLLDAGTGSYSNETPPNGARANIGIYGDSLWASRSATNSGVRVVSYADGGTATGLCTLVWVTTGNATGHQFRLEYSDDSGGTWVTIASGVPGSDGSYVWDTSALGTQVLSMWRIVDQDEDDVSDTVDTLFTVRNGPAYYYVNDAVLEGDIYTTATGDVLNDGTKPWKPKNSVQGILDSYDLEPGDIVYIDTGTNTAGFSVGQQDAGSASNPVIFLGSTNEQYGGTMFTAGVTVKQASGITLQHLNFKGAGTAVAYSEYSGAGVCEWVRVEEGATGFNANGQSVSLTLRNCSVRAASSRGVYVQSSATVAIDHSVFWNNYYGVYVDGGTCRISNSVVGVTGVSRYAYYLGTSGSIIGDYNNITATNSAMVAYRLTSRLPVYYDRLSDWVTKTGYESHSLTINPLFAAPDENDFHLCSQHEQGRYEVASGTWTQDVETSHLIDAGVGAYTNELPPNGEMPNIGLYGNSDQASRTPTNAWVQIISLYSGGRVAGTYGLTWDAGGSATGCLCNLEFSDDGGGTWQVIASNVAVSARIHFWDSTKNNSTPRGKWRIVIEPDRTVMDETPVYFSVRNAGRLEFFVNDGSTTGDVYTTAIGLPTNPGVSSNAPLDSVQTVLDTYDLEPGDIVYVDTGTNSDVITWGYFDSGTNSNPVILQGSTNEAYGGTVMLGRIAFTEAPYVYMRHFNFEGSGTAITYGNYSDNGTCEWVRVLGGSTGIEVNKTTGISAVHCIFDGLSARGIYCFSAGSVNFRSGVIRNCKYGIDNNSSTVTLKNNVIDVSGSGSYAFYLNGGSISSDYNDIFLHSGALTGWKYATPVVTRYDSVGNWALLTGQDTHSLSMDPKLVDPAAGNYREQTNSPLIDAGNPSDEYALEPLPNGSRINIGCYGNTAEAAVTPASAGAVAISLADGGSISGTNILQWNSWNVGQVNVEYSADGGVTWQPIATGVDSSSGRGSLAWNSLNSTSSPAGLWRLLNSSGGAVLSQTTNYFALRNEPLKFYVNDTNQVGDIYCGAPGTAGNLGINSNVPNTSMNYIFDTFDLEGGDTVYVDTGLYTPSAVITIGYFDRGMQTNPVNVFGSTGFEYGGSLVQGQYISISEAEGIHLKNLEIKNSSVRLITSYYADLDSLIFSNSSDAVYLQNSLYANIHGCILHGNQRGVNATTIATGSRIYNNTFVGNSSYCIQGNNSSGVTVENNIFHLATNQYCYSGTALYTTDYNLYDFPGAELMSRTNSPYPTYSSITDWRVKRGHDYRSAATNALFATNAVDYHPQSSVGTYNRATGFWDVYATNSWAVDAGNPSYAFSTEPEPNGYRVNMGAYGGSSEASKGGSNAVLLARSPQEGDVISSSSWPLIWRANRIPASNSLLYVQYSDDNGTNWQALATAPVTNEYVLWQVPVALTGKDVRWRLLDSSTSGQVFSVTNNGPVLVLLEYADLELTMSRVPSGGVNLYNTNVFSITLINHGPNDSTDIRVYDLLTNGLEYVSYTSTNDYYPTTGLWDVGSLPAGHSATLTLYAKTVSTATSLTNQVYLSSYNPWDPNSTNNTVTTNFYVASAADVGITKAVNQSTGLTNNQAIVFQLLATNAGPDTATNVVVNDLLPKGLRYDSHVGDNYTPGTGEWNIGTLAKGSITILSINATITNDGVVIVNTAAVQQVGRPYDQNPNNDIGTVSLNVGTTPAISILGTNLQVIASGNYTPSRTTGTDYGMQYTASGQTTHRFVITNAGSGDLIVSNIAVSGAGGDFALTNTPSYPLTVNSHGSFSMYIRFDPSVSGLRTAVVSVLNNAYTPYSFGLCGTGLAVSAISVRGIDGTTVTNGSSQPSWDKGTDFGALNIALGGRTNILSITNSGDAALQITSIQTNTSHPGEFYVQNPGTIPAGSTADLRITFNPSVEGVRTAQVVLVNNSLLNSSYSFVLRGTGITESVIAVLGKDGITPITNGTETISIPLGTQFGDVDVNGGAATNMLFITNSGNAELVVDDIQFDGSGSMEFSVPLPARPIHIAVGAVTNLVIIFNPQVAGLRDAVIKLSNNDASQTPYQFSLQGNGVVDVAMSVLGTNGALIATNSTTVSVADGTDFGARNIGSGPQTHVFTIANVGTADLTISGYAITNTGASHFSITCPSSVAAGSSSNLLITFDPVSEGVKTADIVLTNDSPKNPYRFRVQGTGITESAIAVLGINGGLITNGAAASSVLGTDFGPVDIHGAAVTNSFSITNSGNKILTISGIQVTGGQTSDFMIISWPSNVAVGGVSNLIVSFNPSATNTRSTTVQISSDATNASLYQFALSGIGSELFALKLLGTNGAEIANNDTAPTIQKGTDFGDQNIAGSPVMHVLRITNSGTGLLLISGDQKTGTGSDDFTLNYPGSVAAGTVSNLAVTFDASANGLRMADIVLVNNATNYAFRVQGTGITVAAVISVLGTNGDLIANPSWTPSMANGTDYGGVTIVSSSTNRLVVTNSGNVTLTNSYSIAGDAVGAFAFVSPPSQVAPGSAAGLLVKFNPHVSGVYTAYVSIANNTTNSPYQFAVKGTGTVDGLNIALDGVTQTTGTVFISWQGPLGLLYQIQGASPVLTGDTFNWYGVYNNYSNRPYITNSVISNLYGFSYSDATAGATNFRLYRVISTNSWDVE